jgi:hypothetical protein
VGARYVGATALCGLHDPISKLHAGGGPPPLASGGVAAPCMPPRRWRAAKLSGARQHAQSARILPGGSGACAAPKTRASEWSPVKFGQWCAHSCTRPWRPRDFARPALGPRRVRCGGLARALFRTKCQAGVWLAFGWGSVGVCAL